MMYAFSTGNVQHCHTRENATCKQSTVLTGLLHSFPCEESYPDDEAVGHAEEGSREARRGIVCCVRVEEKIDFSNVEIEPLFKDFVDFDTFSKSDFRAVKVKACEAVKKSKKLLKFTLDDGTGEDRVILSGIHQYYEPEELWARPASPSRTSRRAR